MESILPLILSAIGGLVIGPLVSRLGGGGGTGGLLGGIVGGIRQHAKQFQVRYELDVIRILDPLVQHFTQENYSCHAE